MQRSGVAAMLVIGGLLLGAAGCGGADAHAHDRILTAVERCDTHEREDAERLTRMEEQLRSLEARVAELTEVVRQSRRDTVAEDPEAALTAALAERAELSARYGPQHPRMIALEAQIEALRQSAGRTASGAGASSP